ncbi:MAG: hypothetical protein HY289_07350 [Planctomycetes bacterium]|nr:hypothetical protein [Planctomycetota bacterium]
MGLAVQVGQLADLVENDEEGADWFRKVLAGLNAVLAEHKLPPHTEPEKLPPLDDRTPIGSYSYSYLHHLRRVAAHVMQDPDWIAKPLAESEDPAADPVVDEESAMMASHLLCHSDCEGFYLPIDFKEIIVDDNGDLIPGGILGSSFTLMKELIVIAPALKIQIANGELSNDDAKKINAEIDQEGPLWIEKAVWISLFEAARLSIQHQTAICFA